MAERRSDARGRRLHRRQAGHDPDLDAGERPVGVDLLEHGGGHGEDPRIARGDHGDARALAGGHVERAWRARSSLDAVVGRMAQLAAALGHARQIRRVADQLVGVRELGLGLRGSASPAPREPSPTTAHASAMAVAREPRRLHAAPGTRTSDMYGTLSPAWASGATRSASLLARST